MKIIISGGRDFTDYEKLKSCCEQVLIFYQGTDEEIEIISGTAKGADSLGARFGYEKGFKVTSMPADWEKYGKAAGYKRNTEMAVYAQLVGDDLKAHEVIKRFQPCLIAFWNGVSKGTSHMIDIARKRGMNVHVIKY